MHMVTFWKKKSSQARIGHGVSRGSNHVYWHGNETMVSETFCVTRVTMDTADIVNV